MKKLVMFLLSMLFAFNLSTIACSEKKLDPCILPEGLDLEKLLHNNDPVMD